MEYREEVEARGLVASRLPVARADVVWTEVLASAFSGDPCVVHGLGQRPLPWPVTAWAAEADASDEFVLAHCGDPTLDIGCGPGRMTQALAQRGVRVLGVDVLPQAVHRTRSRGAAALQRDVFDALPGEGRWACVLLADGNLGIGGDPVALLQRCAALLSPGGRVVADLAPPGAGLTSCTVQLECAGVRSRSFRWSLVDPASITAIALAAGLRVGVVEQHRGRWLAVLTKDLR